MQVGGWVGRWAGVSVTGHGAALPCAQLCACVWGWAERRVWHNAGSWEDKAGRRRALCDDVANSWPNSV